MDILSDFVVDPLCKVTVNGYNHKMMHIRRNLMKSMYHENEVKVKWYVSSQNVD